MSITNEIETTIWALENCHSWEEKNLLLIHQSHVQKTLLEHNVISECLEALPSFEKYMLLALLFLQQKQVVIQSIQDELLLRDLLHDLSFVETFYRSIGGILGYHYKIIRLVEEQNKPLLLSQTKKYSIPHLINIQSPTKKVQTLIKKGIENLPFMAEILPIGGAGDRLGLHHPKTKIPLPAATFPFLGKSLLEGIFQDIEAREYLYFKHFQKAITIPIVLMTSDEKNNDKIIRSLLEEHNYFGRDRDRFLFIKQPSIPVLSENGVWLVEKNGSLQKKPGGHGVLWQLMSQYKAFDWLQDQGAKYALIRQINNPLAGLDYGLLAFMGYGIHEKKEFGFASCARKVGAPEGVNILWEKQQEPNRYQYAVSNIEYTDFIKYNIHDNPISESSKFSSYPANTNLLFFSIDKLKNYANKHPLPGLVINMKNNEYIQGQWQKKGRLELMMQNIADYIHATFSRPLHDNKEFAKLPTYITYNQRIKTMSCIKHRATRSRIKDTPLEALYVWLLANYELLTTYCKMQLPKLPDEKSFYQDPTPYFISYHPALGPLYDDIATKISNGSLKEKSALFLSLSEVNLLNLTLNGTLDIRANRITTKDPSKKVGKLFFENVQVNNKGLDWKNSCPMEGDFFSYESCLIELEGNSELIAKDLLIEGNYHFHIEDGIRAYLVQKGSKIELEKECL